MIVDFHSHNFPPSVATRALSLLTKKTSNRLFPVGDGTLVNQLDYLEQAGIDKAVMCPIATRPEHFDVILATALAIREGRLGNARAKELFHLCQSIRLIHNSTTIWSKSLP